MVAILFSNLNVGTKSLIYNFLSVERNTTKISIAKTTLWFFFNLLLLIIWLSNLLTLSVNVPDDILSKKKKKKTHRAHQI